MSALSAVPWMSLLALSKDEKTTIKNLKSLATTFGVSVVAKDTGITNLLAAVRGEAPPPPWLAKIAKFVNKFGADPSHRPMILDSLKGLVEANGFDYPTLVGLLRKVAPVVGLQPDDLDDDEVVLSTLMTIAGNVQAVDETHSYTGIVQCPSCAYVHIV